MSAKQVNYQSQYKSLKTQYDSLLDKNQNDLIKIKQREKLQADELDRIKRETQAIKEEHAKEVGKLQEELQRQRKEGPSGELVVSVQEGRVKQLEADARSLIDQNISLTAENTSLSADVTQLTRSNQDLLFQADKMKHFIASLEKELAEMGKKSAGKIGSHSGSQTEKRFITEEQITTLKDQLHHLQKELQAMSAANSELKHRLKASEDETRMLSDRQRKSVHLLKKKEVELSQTHEEVQRLRLAAKPRKRKTEQSQSCLKCRQYEQQIQLLKQMVKSTKGMVRVREIEVEKYRMHNNEEQTVKDNKSYGKLNEKGGGLPPLKKHQQAP